MNKFAGNISHFKTDQIRDKEEEGDGRGEEGGGKEGKGIERQEEEEEEEVFNN